MDDVVAYNMASFLDTYCTSYPNFVDKYLDVRPPNNAMNCPKNP